MENTTKTLFTRRRFVGVSAGALAGLMLAGCSSNDSNTNTNTNTGSTGAVSAEKTDIKLGLRADGLDMWESIKDIVAEKGYKVEVVTFDDSIQPNVALAEGSIDLNWYQHLPYLESYNKQNGTNFEMQKPYTHYPLFAMYSSKWTSVDEIPDGATIGLCNDQTNQERGLRLLEEQGLIKLADVENPTKYDIAENPKNIEIIEAEMSVLPQSIDDVDAICLAAMHMFNAGKDPKTYLAEASDAKDYMLGFVLQPENIDSQWAKDFAEAAQSKSFADYCDSNGTLIPTYEG